MHFDLEDMSLQEGCDNESEVEKELLLYDYDLDPEENSVENLILNIVYLKHLADCPINCWSTISNKYEVFLKAFDFSTAYEELMNEPSSIS